MDLASGVGIKPEEFWDMIPSELIVYVKSQYKMINELENKHQERTANILAMIANFSMKNKNKRYKPKDFLPKKKQTDDDMAKQVEMLNRLFGGEDRRTHG